MEGEGGTYAEVDGGGEFVFVLCDPVFLFWAAEADPDEVGSGLADFFANPLEFIVGPIAEGGGVSASNLGVGEVVGEAFLELVQGALFAAKKKMFEFGLG